MRHLPNIGGCTCEKLEVPDSLTPAKGITMKLNMKVLIPLLVAFCVCGGLLAPRTIRNYKNGRAVGSVLYGKQTAEEVALRYLTAQSKSFSPYTSGKLNDVAIKKTASTAVELLSRMGFTADQPEPIRPSEPFPPSSTASPEEIESHEADVKVYKRQMREWNILRDIWSENARSRSHRVLRLRQFHWSGEELTADTAEYIFAENVANHVASDKRKLAVSLIDKMKTDIPLSWLTTSADELLKSELDCVKNVKGECIKQADGQACLLLAPLAEAVTEANARMFEAGKGQIEPTGCYRSNLTQAVAYCAFQGSPCTPSNSRGGGYQLPGESYHLMGLSMDLVNRKQAESFLLDVGMACGFITNDSEHCALGEASPDYMRMRLRLSRMKR